ncbi:hypothetical protein AGMMS49940_19380 [Spirochaetia bacterium]|nr:hypothetical protein AGMMS49940_19380 [Spirochaetia bacterium]
MGTDKATTDKNDSKKYFLPKRKGKIIISIPSFFFILCATILSILCAAITTFIISGTVGNIIPANIYVWGEESAIKIEKEVNDTITTNMEKLYEKSISKLDTSITLFSCALVIFAIVFGFFSLSKINEAQKLLEEIEETPDIVFKRYYKDVYTKSIPDFFSEDMIKRSEAIKHIANNPAIDVDDYDILKKVLLQEFSRSQNVYFYGNTSTIINTLLLLNYKKTIELLRNHFDNSEYDMKFYTLLQYIVADNSNETKQFIEKKLINDPKLGQQLLSLLMSNGVVTQYSEIIIEKCPAMFLSQILNDTISDMYHFKIDKVFETLMKRDSFDEQTMNFIIYNDKNLSIENKIELTVSFYIKDKTNLEQSLERLINVIQDDDNAKQFFVNLVKEKNYMDDIKLFFSAQQHLKDYFKNNNDIFDTIDGKKESNADIIAATGLTIDSDGKILDKNGKEYTPKPFSYSVFTGGLLEVISCITIEGKTIPVSEIKQSNPAEDITNAP